MASTADIAQALKYGPKAGQQMRRSAYLEDALKALSAPTQNINSAGELAARLAGVALLSRASNKAQDRTLQAISDDRKEETARLLAGLGPKAPVAPPQPPSLPPVAQQAPQGPMVAAPPPMQQPAMAQASPQQPPAGPGAYREAVAGIESRGSGDYAALGPVTKTGDRAFGRYQVMGANLPEWTREALGREMSPQEFLADPKAQDAVFDHRFGSFVEKYGSPQQAASVWFTGRPMEQGANRSDQLGTTGSEYVQRFSQGLGPQGAPPQAAQAPQPPMQPMPAPNLQTADAQSQQPPQAAPPPQGEMQPFQVATAGQLQSDMIPSAPASSPPPSGAPPAATPQAAAGGNAPQWPTYQPTQPEVSYVEGLLKDPRTFEQGRAEAMKLQQKMSQPAPAKIVEMNGVQFYVPETPGQGGPPVMIPVPQQAMTRNAPAEQFGVAAARGTIMSADPYNNLKTVVAPQPGQQIASNPGEPYRETFTPGGSNDPYRPQAPDKNYQYVPGGSQQVIPGSPADLKNPANVMEGANRFGGMVKTIVDNAMKVKQNYGAVQTGFKQKNGTGDIAMINGLQKLIDEGVVKGEDVTMQMKSNGLEGTLGSYSQYLSSGGLLSPDIRDKVFQTAGDLYKNLDKTYQVRIQSLQPGFDEAYGQGAFGKYVFPEAFASELGWNGEKPGAAPAAPPQPSSVQIRALQGVKGYDRSKPLGDPAHPFVAVDDATVQKLDTPANRGKHIVLPNGAIAVID